MAARTITDAQVIDAVREAAWTINAAGQRVLAPEGLYGRRKMTALIRRRLPQASAGAVDRAMRVLGLQGVRRLKKVRTTVPAVGSSRAADLLDRDFTAAAPNLVWITDFTYVRSWAGFVYVAFIVDVFAQRIVAWHAAKGSVFTRCRQSRIRKTAEVTRYTPQAQRKGGRIVFDCAAGLDILRRGGGLCVA